MIVQNHFVSQPQTQYSYTVVESLMTHLDENSKASAKIRTSIADVLSKIIAIAAGESVGTCSDVFGKLKIERKANVPENSRTIRFGSYKFITDSSADVGVVADEAQEA